MIHPLLFECFYFCSSGSQDDYQIAGSWAQNYRDHLVDLTLSDDEELGPGADLESATQQVMSVTDIQIIPLSSSAIHSLKDKYSSTFI